MEQRLHAPKAGLCDHRFGRCLAKEISGSRGFLSHLIRWERGTPNSFLDGWDVMSPNKRRYRQGPEPSEGSSCSRVLQFSVTRVERPTLAIEMLAGRYETV